MTSEQVYRANRSLVSLAQRISRVDGMEQSEIGSARWERDGVGALSLYLSTGKRPELRWSTTCSTQAWQT